MTGISAEPYWWQAAPPQDFHIEHWPDRADVVIIGGGYTGFGARQVKNLWKDEEDLSSIPD